jgi:uncharacterized membrane protein
MRRLKQFGFGMETWYYMGAALVLGFTVPRLHQYIFRDWISPVDKATMTAILAAIAGGMITLSGLVFSLAFVLVQFGSATYSPRITRVFARSRVLHHSLGIFTGTFLYALMALRTIGMEGMRQVSGLAVWLAMAWLLGSVSVLARMIAVFGTMTVTNILAALSRAGRASIARVYGPSRTGRAPASMRPARGPRKHDLAGETVQRVIYDGEPGYVIGYNIHALTGLARVADVIIYLPYAIGDALKDGAAIALVRGNAPAVSESLLYKGIVLGGERTFREDPKYSLRLLVDMAIRALSPAVNDPTTAVQALDHIEALLRRIGNSNLDIGEVRDDTGAPRVVFSTPGWDDYLQLGLSEIMQYGAASIQVERRIEALLRFLRQATPPDRTAAVDRFARHRRVLSAGAFDDATFRAWANVADREGIGGGSDGLHVADAGIRPAV